jgi:tetratricopeptide (TPR) repeat protein
MLGECFEKMELYEQSLEQYNFALKHDEFFVDAMVGKAVVLDAMEKSEAAIFVMQKALELEKDNGEFWFIYTEILTKKGEFEEAEIAFLKTIKLIPNDTDVWLDFSEFYYKQEKIDNAIHIAEEGLQNLPGDYEIFYRLAALNYSKGNHQEADVYLQKALAIDKKGIEDMFTFLPFLRTFDRINHLLDSHN